MDSRHFWTLGQAEAYAYLVVRGKPAACFMVRAESLSAVVGLAEQAGCRTYVEAEMPEGWATLWLYTKPLILEVIKALPLARTDLPPAVQRWLEGCLFGYSLEQIETGCRLMSVESQDST